MIFWRSREERLRRIMVRLDRGIEYEHKYILSIERDKIIIFTRKNTWPIP